MPYSNSEYHLRISQIETYVLQQIIMWMAGDEAVGGTKIVDSSGFSVSRRIKWYNAKYGNISVKPFAKTHLLHTPQGKICIAMVTSGKANDSPYPRMMIKMLPRGSGDLLGDAACRGIKNCNAVRDSGRRPS